MPGLRDPVRVSRGRIPRLPPVRAPRAGSARGMPGVRQRAYQAARRRDAARRRGRARRRSARKRDPAGPRRDPREGRPRRGIRPDAVRRRAGHRRHADAREGVRPSARNARRRRERGHHPQPSRLHRGRAHVRTAYAGARPFGARRGRWARDRADLSTGALRHPRSRRARLCCVRRGRARGASPFRLSAFRTAGALIHAGEKDRDRGEAIARARGAASRGRRRRCRGARSRAGVRGETRRELSRADRSPR